MAAAAELVVLVVAILQLFGISVSISDHSPAASALFIHSDASALLAFKEKADLDGKLIGFSSDNSSGVAFCQWSGVRCGRGRVVRVVFQGVGLSGGFAPGTLSELDRLRVLSLRRNLLTGPIPDLSGLGRLKFLFLDHNLFSGAIPPSISDLRRLRTLDLSHNQLAGPVPDGINGLDQLENLRLESNLLNGPVPPLNLTNLETFNISLNRLSGPVPVTLTLSRFNNSSFFSNKGLCGKIVGKECHSVQPFFPRSISAAKPPPPTAALSQNAAAQNAAGLYSVRKKPSNKSFIIIAVSAMGSLALVCAILCFALATRKMAGGGNQISSSSARKPPPESSSSAADRVATRIEEEEEEKAKKVKEGMLKMGKSGNLVFCAGEAAAYTLEQLMTASAELLGRGTMATTYKAVLDNRAVVCVKRLDAGKVGGTNKDDFERHMESVGKLRHPNLVALRAYFHANEERILVYDYHRNGNLHSLIHGTAKPLHWTSCLKIAEDVAQALSYIHQAWRLVHGNLKPSNILLGSDFEACLSDYCLSVLAAPISDDEDQIPNSAAYKAPELRRSNRHRRPTTKSDVFSFGVLLLEILTGKPPPEHPFLPPEEMAEWVRAVREDGGGGENGDRTEMILEVGLACRISSPEQRPDMWQVLKMIQEIKDGVIMEDCQEMDLLITGT
ncbi:probable inactive receptor kinase At5g67200 [Ipomoea triloba]|uniref:probable inactive receptor kinase At5g67200 n=1 Tax=Ipomoea triloba TaxID=35885 RepID=UPI00125D5345|nr:probable inactive receptor kinase At5g67200 [Ipomoea triloba]